MRPPVDDQPPVAQNLEAEQATLGSMLLDKIAAQNVLTLLVPEDFYRAAHTRIYQTMKELNIAGQPVDLVTVAASLRDNGHLGTIGGAAYLARLMDSVPTAANSIYYARIVEECSQRRECTGVMSETLAGIQREDVGDWRKSLRGLVDVCERATISAAQAEEPDPLARRLALLDSLLSGPAPSGIAGISTGYPSLDYMTSGLERGEVILIAGRPGMGKSAFATSIASHVAGTLRKAALVASLEMMEEALWRRIWAAKSGVSLHVLKTRLLSPEQLFVLEKTASETLDWPLKIITPPILTVPDMRMILKADIDERGTELLVIDYVQKMTGAGASITEQMTRISGALKALALEVQIPILVLAQLNRAPDARVEKRPSKSDLAWASALEADADVILFPYRPNYYDAPGSSAAGEPEPLEIIVAKERDGETGVVKAEYIPNRTHCYEPEWLGR